MELITLKNGTKVIVTGLMLEDGFASWHEPSGRKLIPLKDIQIISDLEDF